MKDEYNPVAIEIPFDNDTNGFVSDDVQSAIEENKNDFQNSASPGFSWGRSGNITPSTWLLNEGVPSNKSGRTNFLTNAEIKKIFVANEVASTFTLEFFYHDGDEVNLTSLGTITNTATKSSVHDVVFSVPLLKQIAVKVDTGSPKNIVVGALISGSLI